MTQEVEYVDQVGDLYFRAIHLSQVGDMVPQHIHDYDHVTLVCAGAVRMVVDGEAVGDFKAFRAVTITANKLHLFQALEPDTRLACVHILKDGEPYSLTKG